MPQPNEHRLTIFENTIGDERHRLDAVLGAAGDLVLEGQDLGRSVEEIFGDSDFEYWRTVAAAHVPRVLLQLIKDRFHSESEFHAWLETNGIPSEFSCY